MTNEQILDAADCMYLALRRYRAERTVENLAEIVRFARLIESMSYTPALIKHGRALQVMRNNVCWVVPGVVDEVNA